MKSDDQDKCYNKHEMIILGQYNWFGPLNNSLILNILTIGKILCDTACVSSLYATSQYVRCDSNECKYSQDVAQDILTNHLTPRLLAAIFITDNFTSCIGP